MNNKVQANLDIIWGAQAIAETIGKPRRVVYRMLENEQLPGAKRVGDRWCISRRKLVEFFEAVA